MSADNWIRCPRCVHLCKVAQQQAVEDAGKAYGKVPAKEYLRLLDKASESVKIPDNLREDWEIGLEEDGRFVVRYYASCSACGWEYRFRADQKAYEAKEL